MSTIQLPCCENLPVYEIDYSIGSTYLVCDCCFTKPHFQRGIKLKKEIGSVSKLGQSQMNTRALTEVSDTC